MLSPYLSYERSMRRDLLHSLSRSIGSRRRKGTRGCEELEVSEQHITLNGPMLTDVSAFRRWRLLLQMYATFLDIRKPHADGGPFLQLWRLHMSSEYFTHQTKI